MARAWQRVDDRLGPLDDGRRSRLTCTCHAVNVDRRCCQHWTNVGTDRRRSLALIAAGFQLPSAAAATATTANWVSERRWVRCWGTGGCCWVARRKMDRSSELASSLSQRPESQQVTEILCYRLRFSLLCSSSFIQQGSCASISLHGWGTHSGQSTPHYCPPLIRLHSSPRNGVRSHSRCGTESWTELELVFHLTVAFLILDYRVLTTPCTSRLKTKKD